MPLDDLNEKLSVAIPTDDADTLGGFVFHTLGRLPKLREKIEVQHLTIQVISIVGQKIKILELRTLFSNEKTGNGSELIER
jgi:putative hemolysin